MAQIMAPTAYIRATLEESILINLNVKIGISLKCRECEGYGHYEVECPNFMRRPKKIFSVTLSDDDLDESNEEGECTKAFISILSKDEVEDSEEENKDNLSFEQLKIKWKEDSEARALQKEKNTESYGRK